MTSKLPHNYFEIAGKSFILYLDKMFSPFKERMNDFPIQIKNTGDESFLTNKDNNKAIYTSIPRMTLDTRTISILSDQLSNHNVHGRVVLKNQLGFDETKITPVRRIPINWTFDTEIRFNNVLEYLQFIDILLTVSHHNHSFQFFYLGNVYSATFFLPEDFDPETNLSLGFDSEKRSRILPLTFVLQLQFPAYDFYQISQAVGPEILDASKKMNTIVHNIYEEPGGLIQTTEITKQNE